MCTKCVYLTKWVQKCQPVYVFKSIGLLWHLAALLQNFQNVYFNNYYSFEINITNYKLVNSHGAKKFTFTELRILA